MITLGHFSLPEGIPNGTPRTFLVLDEGGKIVNASTQEEISYVQFARSVALGDITLTEEGTAFVEEKIIQGFM